MDVAAGRLLAVVPRSSDAASERPAYGESVIVPPRITRTLVLAVVAMVPAAVANGSPVPGAPSCPMTPANSFWHVDVSMLMVSLVGPSVLLARLRLVAGASLGARLGIGRVASHDRDTGTPAEAGRRGAGQGGGGQAGRGAGGSGGQRGRPPTPTPRPRREDPGPPARAEPGGQGPAPAARGPAARRPRRRVAAASPSPSAPTPGSSLPRPERVIPWAPVRVGTRSAC